MDHGISQAVNRKNKGCARVIEGLDGVLDALGAEGERAIRQSRGARDALQLRYPLRLLTIVQKKGERVD